ncbi:hypothetical protein FXW78_45760 [Rhodococcus opacus]|nr:hypothetical protein [Rhodococcus opacus]
MLLPLRRVLIDSTADGWNVHPGGDTLSAVAGDLPCLPAVRTGSPDPVSNVRRTRIANSTGESDQIARSAWWVVEDCRRPHPNAGSDGSRRPAVPPRPVGHSTGWRGGGGIRYN